MELPISQGPSAYTPKKTGTFDVIAKKSGYNDGKASLVVRTASEAAAYAAVESANETLANQLTLNAPSEVTKGENFLVTVVEGINQTPVEGAEIFFDSESIGNTSDQGMLTYSANVTGEHDLLAKEVRLQRRNQEGHRDLVSEGLEPEYTG